jgi:hypothetical protein
VSAQMAQCLGSQHRPSDLPAVELHLMSPPQAEDIPATKKPRLEELLSTSVDEADRKIPSHDVSVGLPPPVADNDDVNVDPVTDMQPNAVATGAAGHWTTDEGAKLTKADANTSKKKWGNEYKTNWDAVATLVPGRTRKKCFDGWKNNSLDSIIDGMARRTGIWTAVEDSNLKDAVKTHGGKDWGAITALVPGRTRFHCYKRWHDVFDPTIDQVTGRTGKWAEDEGSKLKDAVQLHGDKD